MSESLFVSRPPWTYKPAYDVSGDRARHVGNYVIESEPDGTILATVWVGKCARFGDLVLMAASPRLLDACVTALHYLENHVDHAAHDVEEEIAVLRAAIAEAMGGSTTN